jgi:hypothetical protein
MPFKALRGGEVLSALACDEATWSALRGDTSLTLPCCGRAAIAKRSPRGTRFFQHQPRRDAPKCPWEGESEDHRNLKAAVASAIAATAGWAADIEHSGDGWRADVLAVPGDPALPRIAFEVQLAQQRVAATAERDAAYAASRVVPVWLVNSRNHRATFGTGRRLPLRPADAGLEARAEGAARRVGEFLQRATWQARAAAACARAAGVEVAADRGMPAIVSTGWMRDAGCSGMVFAMSGLGADAEYLPRRNIYGIFTPPFPVVVRWPGKRPSSPLDPFTIEGPQDDPEAFGASLVSALRDGSLAFVDDVRLPVSVVHYRETCRECTAEFEVGRWALIGGGMEAPTRLPAAIDWDLPLVVPLSSADWADARGETPWYSMTKRFYQARRAAEINEHSRCPGCGKALPPHRITEEEAMHWPAEHTDGWCSPKDLPPAGWTRMGQPRALFDAAAAHSAWVSILAAHEARLAPQIAAAKEAEKRKREAQEARLQEMRDRHAAEERQRREDAAAAERAEWARQRAEAEEQRRQAAEQAASERERIARSAADALFAGAPEKAELWLRTRQDGQTYLDIARESDAGLQRIIAAAKKRR